MVQQKLSSRLLCPQVHLVTQHLPNLHMILGCPYIPKMWSLFWTQQWVQILGLQPLLQKKEVWQTVVVNPNKMLVVAMDIESRLGVPPIGTNLFWSNHTQSNWQHGRSVGITFANVNDYGRQICWLTILFCGSNTTYVFQGFWAWIFDQINTIVGCIGSNNATPHMKPILAKFAIIYELRLCIESLGLGVEWVTTMVTSGFFD